jgi:polysaccharide export outer membrane protein
VLAAAAAGALFSAVSLRAAQNDPLWDLLGSDAAAHVRALSSEAVGRLPSASSNAPPAGVSGGTLKADTLDSLEALDDKQKLGVGDRLSLRIVEDREEAKDLQVTDSGEIDVPYIGRVPATGKTCKAVATEIKQLLEQEYYHRATPILAIDLLSRSRGRVYVVGQVRVTGPIEIPGNEVFTVSKAILVAGGFGEFADKKRVRITRRAETAGAAGRILVDVGQILEAGRTELDVTLQPDDMVFVPTRWLNL